MAKTFTTRLGIAKPTPGTGEPVNLADLNAAWDAIDGAVGAKPVTSSTRPATPWDGQTIRETDTRRAYMWNATQGAWDQILLPGPAKFLSPIEVERSSATGSVINSQVTNDAVVRFNVLTDGKFEWGGGAVARDTNLYRSAPDTLKTDDNFEVAGNLTVTGVGQRRTSFKTTNQSVINNASLQNATSLSMSVVANAVYIIDLLVIYEAPVANDMKVAFTFPAGATFPWGMTGIQSAAADTTDDLQPFAFGNPVNDDPFVVGGGGAGNQLILLVRGTLTVGGTAGTVQFRFAQGTAGAGLNATIWAGSRFTAERIA